MHTFKRLAVSLLIVVFSVTGCKKATSDVTPAPDEKETVVVPVPGYFDGYMFQPKELDDDNYRVLVNFCNPTIPRDLDISIWIFPPDTNLDEDLASVVAPGYDDDGQPNEPDSPDYYVTAQAKYTTPEGDKLSDFTKKRQFAVDLDKNVICVLVYYDANDVPIYTVVDTRNANTIPAEVCLRGN